MVSHQEAGAEPCGRDNDITEHIAAVDEAHNLQPVRQLQTLHALWGVLRQEADRVLRGEKRNILDGPQGQAIPVEDSGGRDAVRRIAVDLTTTAANMNERARVAVERAATGATAVHDVNSACLAIPTGAPLSMYDARTWTVTLVCTATLDSFSVLQ